MFRDDNKYQSFEELNGLDLGRKVKGKELGIQVAYLMSSYTTSLQHKLPEILESTGTQYTSLLNGTYTEAEIPMSVCDEKHKIYN